MGLVRQEYPVPSSPPEGPQFLSSDLQADDTWVLSAPQELQQDLEQLEQWAAPEETPCSAYTPDQLELPAVHKLATDIRSQLTTGFGIAWVRGFAPQVSHQLASLAYLALGHELGEIIDTYGKLYDVVDVGESYKEKAIPVSQTRESTGMHTDSSRLHTLPDFVGLLCQRAGAQGGASRITSAIAIHEALRQRDPALLSCLYRDFIRDIVTPGSKRDMAQVRENVIPVFRFDSQLTLRYMRYWIETGHEIARVPLSPEELEAFDALDEELKAPQHMHRFMMQPGDMMWIANRLVAHDRDAYQDDPANPRWMVRQWIRNSGTSESLPKPENP